MYKSAGCCSTQMAQYRYQLMLIQLCFHWLLTILVFIADEKKPTAHSQHSAPFADCLTDVFPTHASSFILTPSPSISSRFARNPTVNEIVESLFIESWITNISFDDYFIECRPSSGTYTIIYRQSITFIITSIMGLYGGLTISLRLSTPIVVKIVRKLVQLRGRTQNLRVRVRVRVFLISPYNPIPLWNYSIHIHFWIPSQLLSYKDFNMGLPWKKKIKLIKPVLYYKMNASSFIQRNH